MDSTVILDWGSHTFKAGTAVTFPSEDEPQIVIPSAVRADEAEPAGPSGAPSETRQVVDQGRITDWPGFEVLTHHCLYSQVCYKQCSSGSYATDLLLHVLKYLCSLAGRLAMKATCSCRSLYSCQGYDFKLLQGHLACVGWTHGQVCIFPITSSSCRLELQSGTMR